MKLWPNVVFAAALICVIAALGTCIQYRQEATPRDTDTTFTQSSRETFDRIACWAEKFNGQADH
jgi:hypothetical protein